MICAQANPDAVTHRKAIIQAHAEAHATAEPFADCDSRQPHGSARACADAAPDAVAVFATDNAVAYRLARRTDNESRAPASRCSDADANAATLPAADA